MRFISFVVLALIVLGGYFLLHLSGVFKSYFGHRIVARATDPLNGTSLDGSIIGAVVTWTGGLIALLTYFYTYHQKERTLAHQIEVEHERSVREKALAEKVRLETVFDTYVRDFTSDAQLSRFNAAMGLAEVATKPDPLRIKSHLAEIAFDEEHYRSKSSFFQVTGEFTTIPIAWPQNWRTRKTDGNYPLFNPACKRLVLAATYWEDLAASRLCVTSLKDLANWAKESETDEPLLHYLINQLAESNRTIWKQAKSLLGIAHHQVTLAHLYHFGFSVPTGLDTIGVDIPTELRSSTMHLQKSWNLQNDEWEQIQELEDDFSIEDIEIRSNSDIYRALERLQLISEALVSALKELGRPPHFVFKAKTPAPGVYFSQRESSRLFVKQRSLNLNDICLLGQDLSGCQLAGADLSNSTFLGCTIDTTSLEFCDLRNLVLFASALTTSSLDFTYSPGLSCTLSKLNGTSFRAAMIKSCSFKYCTAHTTSFSLAYLDDSRFFGVNGVSADFSLCSLKHTSIRHSYLVNANLDRTLVYNADIYFSPGGAPTFVGSNWPKAIFSDTFLDSSNGLVSQWKQTSGVRFDQDLWRALDRSDPLANGKKRTPPWESTEGQPT